MIKVFLIIALLPILFFSINKFSLRFVNDHTSYQLQHDLNVPVKGTIIPWLNFDGLNYLDIVEQGYKSNKALTAFYPLYPLLITIFSLNLKLNPIIIGLLISYFSTAFAIVLFYKLSLKATGSEIDAYKAVVLFALFPASFYLLAYYTEGLFFLLSVLFFWFLKKESFTLASFFAIIASATRLFGLALVGALIVESYLYFKKKGKYPFIVFASPMGFVFYSIYLEINFGNPFLMFFAQSDQKFGRTLSILSPLRIVPDTLFKIIQGPQARYDNIFVYPVILIESFFCAYLIILLIISFKKIDLSYWIYLLLSFILIMAGGSLSSVMRYSLALLPAYFFLSKYLRGLYFVIWLVISFLLLVFSSSLFLRNYWIA